uniref:Ixodegrin B n=1 Tax=Rhipicephalus appendiculatus TaxID=34631 RepID=A0A131Z3N1_RHIAP
MNGTFRGFRFYLILVLLVWLAEESICPKGNLGRPATHGRYTRAYAELRAILGPSRGGRPPTHGRYTQAHAQMREAERALFGPPRRGRPPTHGRYSRTQLSAARGFGMAAPGEDQPGFPLSPGDDGDNSHGPPPQLSPGSPIPGPSGLGLHSNPPWVPPSHFPPGPASSPGSSVAGPSQPGRPQRPQADLEKWLGLPHVRRTYNEHILHPALAMLMPRPGEPGSPENPGNIQPGPTQHWLASVFHRGFIPRERLRLRDQLCNERTICEEGTCCLEIPGKSRLCKPTATRGQRCTLRALISVYIGHCFCGYNQGTCENGYCT